MTAYIEFSTASHLDKIPECVILSPPPTPSTSESLSGAARCLGLSETCTNGPTTVLQAEPDPGKAPCVCQDGPLDLKGTL